VFPHPAGRDPPGPAKQAPEQIARSSRNLASRSRRLKFPASLPARRVGDAWRLHADGRELRVSNLDKVYWPEDGFTKRDLLAYYWNVAPLLLPHLVDRPLTMLRMPEGIHGEAFFEKRVPGHAPDWLPTAPVPAEDGKVNDMVMAQDLASLIYIANLGCIELHPLHSKADSLDRPEFALFDLDPFEPYTYADVRTVAKLIKVVLDGLGLRGYAKTSGATGMQVYVPLEPVHSYSEVRSFVERVGRMVVRAYREKTTMAWRVADRSGKVFIDHQMNRRGANIASVYSLRPRVGAPVSTPLDWDELDEDLEPDDFRIDNVWGRFAEGDRFAPVLTDRQTLAPVLETLGISVGDDGDEEAGEDATPRRRSSRWGRSGGTTPARGTPARASGRTDSADETDATDGAKRTTATGATEATTQTPATARPSRARGTSPKEPPRGDLSTYEAKRDFSRTPEPGPAPKRRKARAAAGKLPDAPHAAGIPEPAKLEPGPVFVIQQHHARALHHDVRFEHDGVLVSFAVPKRLPDVPKVRHLAVNTEDHPMDYLTFSGSIPEGEYGGGEVRLFDLGTYEPLEIEDGKWTVRLHGSRYHGAEYHFIRTRNKDWICFLAGSEPLPAPAKPPTFEPMMAQLVRDPFDGDDWLFEVKWDGHRCLAALEAETTRLTSRTSRAVTGQFPEFENLHRQLAARNAVVDGEVIALDQDGRPSFQRMQDRFHRSPEELARHRGRVPVNFVAFDLLWLDGQPLLELPLAERRARLREVLVPQDDVRFSEAVEGHGSAFFEQIRDLGLEGVVAKRLASQYRPGSRSPDWRKVKAVRRQDCVIVGWSKGKGGRSSTLGSLLVAVYDGDELRYVGNVGTGFTQSFLQRLLPDLEARETDKPPVKVPSDPRLRGAHWMRPELVCEVEYLRWTDDWRLRAPSFKGIRGDKLPRDCRREDVPEAL
jgi:bifunctional non-homologous end joining protein LigD